MVIFWLASAIMSACVVVASGELEVVVLVVEVYGGLVGGDVLAWAFILVEV
jgi:urease accessory protein UreH